MLVSFIEQSLRNMRQRQDKVKEILVSNGVSSMEQYKYLTGRINGLEEGIVSLQETYDKMVEHRSIIDTRE